MPRSARSAPGGMVIHVLNRRVDKQLLFNTDADYQMFEDILAEGVARFEMRLLAHCLMPNHFHQVAWPREDGQLSEFMKFVEGKHAMRWKLRHDAVGRGHLYQNRYKSFPVQSDDHYFTVIRYVERNALRANLVERAEDWPYSSLWRRRRGCLESDPLLSKGPLELPDNWESIVNEPHTQAELEALRRSVNRGSPFGAERWRQETARRLRIESTLNPRGRPRIKLK